MVVVSTINKLFISKISKASLVIEDDGRVAYAYLKDDSDLVCADVWLYNRCASPIEPEWPNLALMPFANPKCYATHADEFKCPDSAEDISISWTEGSPELEVKILIRGNLFALLRRGDKPGKSLLATKNGPLAKVLLNDFHF